MAVSADLVSALAVVVAPAAGLGGYWLAGRNEEAKDVRTAERERESRKADRSERLADERHELQLDTLRALQKGLHNQMRATAKILLQDRNTLKKNGQIFRLPEELDDEAYRAQIEIGWLQERVLDDQLRTELSNFQLFTAGLGNVSLQLRDLESEDAVGVLDDALDDLSNAYESVTTRLGVLLRQEISRT